MDTAEPPVVWAYMLSHIWLEDSQRSTQLRERTQTIYLSFSFLVRHHQSKWHSARRPVLKMLMLLLSLIGGPNTNDGQDRHLIHHTIGEIELYQSARCFEPVVAKTFVIRHIKVLHCNSLSRCYCSLSL